MLLLKEDSSLPPVLSACSRDKKKGREGWREGERVKKGDRGIVEGRRR